MDYELAKKLEAAGLTWNDDYPTLEELIEACGDTVFFDLVKCKDGWVATDHYLRGDGVTPTEAVARLWLALNTTL